jgi:hypothetical protein
MRLFVVIAFALASTTASYAQDEESSRAAAAHDLITAVTSDDRILDLIEAAAIEQLPERVQAIRDSPAFQAYTPQHQSALVAALTTLPSVFRSEYENALGPVAMRVAQRISPLMTREEFLVTAQAFRRPENDALVAESVTRAFSGVDSNSAFPDLSTTEAGSQFLTTPAGQAFSNARPQIDQIILEESVTLANLGPRLRAIGMAVSCDALEEECPPRTRELLGRP